MDGSSDSYASSFFSRSATASDQSELLLEIHFHPFHGFIIDSGDSFVQQNPRFINGIELFRQNQLIVEPHMQFHVLMACGAGNYVDQIRKKIVDIIGENQTSPQSRLHVRCAL